MTDKAKRVVKEPAIRRLEILNSAKKLFEKNGYNNTAVEAIIQDVGIAKGTFYHYFKTKKDILEELVELFAEDMKLHFESILNAENLSAIEKLKLMIRGEVKKKKVSTPIMKILHHPENRELQEKLNIKTIIQIAPILTKVIEQGFKEKTFKKNVSIESMQLILASSLFVLDSGLFAWSATKRKALLQSLQEMFEISVQVKLGALKFISEE